MNDITAEAAAVDPNHIALCSLSGGLIDAITNAIDNYLHFVASSLIYAVPPFPEPEHDVFFASLLKVKEATDAMKAATDELIEREVDGRL